MLVTATAPIRICDCGGWTDTWFAGHGRVFNIAVRPLATVQVATFEAGPGPDRRDACPTGVSDACPTGVSGDRPAVLIDAADFGDRYAPRRVESGWDRHPLIEAAIESMPAPGGVAIEVFIACDIPAGAGTGTSAAVTVALLGALDRVRGGSLSRRDIARAAQAIETERLGQQCGIQDQICAAMGGVNDITMSAYPEADLRQMALGDSLAWELERRLALVLLGRGHSSSDIHEQVIARLEGAGPDAPELQALREAAGHARDAVASGDLDALGRAMIANVEAQRSLHPALVSRDAKRVIAIAREHGAAGWKVNGAGGEGGSLTLLGPRSAVAHREMLRAIRAESAAFRDVPVTLDADGLRVWSA
jgi:D-glycero-alpha-D-manno-heptose-7-phosphate kinase